MTDDTTANPTPPPIPQDSPPPLVNETATPVPSYTPPPVPPPAAPQPPVAWQAAPAVAVAVKGKRTGLALIAGILMILGGILFGILGIAVAVIGGTFFSSLGNFAEIPELNGANAGDVLGGVIAFLGIIVVVYSLVYIIGGIGVVRNRNWGRVLGIIVGIISGLIWLQGITTSGEISSAGAGAAAGQGSLVSGLVGFGVHAYIVVVLLFFWRSKEPASA